MAKLPSTSTQIPVESILDINGKQTYLGNAFILPINGTTLADTTEVPITLIKNAATNPKSLFVFGRNISSSDVVFFRYYFNPTVTSNGTPTTPVNLRSGSATTSSSTCFLTPTIASNGTLISILSSEVLIQVNSTVIFIIDPGKTLLITAQTPTSGGGILANSESVWYEI